MTSLSTALGKKQAPAKFLIMSTYAELLDLAIQLQLEKQAVLLHIPDKDYAKIGDGIVKKADNWHRYVGEGYIWIVDGCEHADLQEWLRSKGERVIGTNKTMSEYENDRQKGQAWFKRAGFNQPESHNFTDFEEATDFILDNDDRRWILKQNGDAPKHLNHKGKFEDGRDMLYHLDNLKRQWNEAQFGQIDFDLMEIVEGTEVAASAFFNGHDWLRNEKGKVVGYLNFEEKKEADGDRGETTGETGTTFQTVTEDDELFRDILLRPEIAKELKRTKYQGIFDINGSLTDEGYVAFEATSRFGIPATSYEFITGLDMKTADLLEIMAKGEDKPIKLREGVGMVLVVTAKPYPTEADMDDEATSIGERLWPLKNGEPVDDFSDKQLSRIHLQNFRKDDDGYKVATKNGYLLTITGHGEDIESVRDDIIEYIDDNLYMPGAKFRTDIGKRVEDFV